MTTFQQQERGIFPDPAYLLFSDRTKTFVNFGGLFRFAPDVAPSAAGDSSPGKIAGTQFAQAKPGESYHQILDLKVTVADAEVVLNQDTLCALLEVVQVDGDAEVSSTASPSRVSTPQKFESPDVGQETGSKPAAMVSTNSVSGVVSADNKQSAKSILTHGVISEVDRNVINCSFTLGKLALTMQHPKAGTLVAVRDSNKHAPLAKAVVSGLSLHYRDNTYSFGIAASLGDIVVHDLRSTAGSTFSRVSPKVLLSSHHPDERRNLFEFMLHETLARDVSKTTSTDEPVDNRTEVQPFSDGTDVPQPTSQPTAAAVVPICVKRHCKVELRPIEVVFDAPFVSQVATTLTDGALARTFLTEEQQTVETRSTHQQLPVSSVDDQEKVVEDEASLDLQDPSQADAANFPSYRAYKFSHPSRFSYDLAILHPSIRIPALISANATDANDLDDDNCSVFFNFKHFKVQLKDTNAWRGASSEQRKLLAEVSAIQLYKLRQQSFLPQNARMRRLRRQTQRIDKIFMKAFDVSFRFSTTKSLAAANPNLLNGPHQATVSTDSFLDISEVNMKLTEHWALLLYTMWRTNFSRLEIGGEAASVSKRNSSMNSDPPESQRKLSDTITTFQCVAPGITLHLTKPLSSLANDAALSSARDYRPTKDRDIAVFAVHALDFSMTNAEDNFLVPTEATKELTVKGTVGNIVFDYLRRPDDISWASSLFVLPTDGKGEGEASTQMPTRLTLFSGELEHEERNLPVTRAAEPIISQDVNTEPGRHDEDHDEEHDEDEDDDEDDDDSDVEAATAAEAAAVAAATITPFVSTELNISENKLCSVNLELNAPRLIVAPQAYMVSTHNVVYAHVWALHIVNSRQYICRFWWTTPYFW